MVDHSCIKYIVRVNYNGTWINGSYTGRSDDLDFQRSTLKYDNLETVCQVYYGLTIGGTISYLPPNVDAPSGLKLLSSEDDIEVILEKQHGEQIIKLYILPPRDPLGETLWRKVQRQLEKTQENPTTVNKGKRPMENQLDSSGFNEYDIDGVVDAVAKELEKAKSAATKKKVFDPEDYMDYDLEEETETNSDSDTVSDSNWKAEKENEDNADTSEVDDDTKLKRDIKGKWKVDEARIDRIDVDEGVIGVDAQFGMHGETDFALFPALNVNNFDEAQYPSDTLRTPPPSDVEDEVTSVERHDIVDLEVDEDLNNGKPNNELVLGMQFVDVKTFRQYMVEHSITHGYEPDFSKKNCPNRVHVFCKVEGCPFKVVGVKMKNQKTFQLRELIKDHSCSRAYKTRKISGKWIAKHYIQLIRNEPKVKSKTIAGEISERYNFDVKRWNVQEGIRIAREKLRGDRAWQFERLRDYAGAVMMHNPGSSVVIHVDPIPNPLRPRFERLYVCLKACVDAFRECRPFIGLDGCHLKGLDGGQLLNAVTRDADNRVVPIAYAWVEAETRDSWTWFLDLLKRDIRTERSLIFMSDRQKGLISAVENVWPGNEHRFCAMHIYKNMQIQTKQFDVGIKTRFWAAACAYNYHRHKTHMDWLKLNFIEAWKYLSEIDTKTWCRYEFHPESKTDLVVNNCSESWNSKILEARDKPPVSLMESLRRMIMLEFQQRRLEAEKHEGSLMKNVNDKINDKKLCARGMNIHYSGQQEYEVLVGTSYQYKVDLNNRTCSCLEWDLSGIPCAHASACIMDNRDARVDFAPYVDPCYHVQAMRRIYTPIIHPLPGPDDWVRVNGLPIDPPLFRRRGGRPKKKRTKGPHEKTNNTNTRLTKHGLKQYCSRCGQTGHNKRGCPLTKAGAEEASQVPSQPSQHKLSKGKRKTNGDDGGAGTSSQPRPSQKKKKGKEKAHETTTNVRKEIPNESHKVRVEDENQPHEVLKETS